MTTGFLYDGATVVQELEGTTNTAVAVDTTGLSLRAGTQANEMIHLGTIRLESCMLVQIRSEESHVEIADKQALSVLLTSLYVAKWESDEENAHVVELSGSPYLARLYNDAVDEMIRLEAGRPDAVRTWQRWRAIEAHPDQLERTRARIQAIELWPSWSRTQKQQMLEYLISPFTATPATLEQLLSL